jgi:hypothetical protein
VTLNKAKELRWPTYGENVFGRVPGLLHIVAPLVWGVFAPVGAIRTVARGGTAVMQMKPVPKQKKVIGKEWLGPYVAVQVLMQSPHPVYNWAEAREVSVPVAKTTIKAQAALRGIVASWLGFSYRSNSYRIRSKMNRPSSSRRERTKKSAFGWIA